MVSFDRSCFKLSSRKFPNKLLHALSCERPKTAPRTLFLLYTNNNYFPITVLCRNFLKKSVSLYARWGIQTSLLVLCRHAKYRYLSRYLKRFFMSSDSYRLLKFRGGCTIPLFQLSVWCEKRVAARHYADIGIQLFFANNRNTVRGAVLGLSQDGACTDLFENLNVNSLKGYLSNTTTFKPPLFSLVNAFKWSYVLYIF